MFGSASQVLSRLFGGYPPAYGLILFEGRFIVLSGIAGASLIIMIS